MTGLHSSIRLGVQAPVLQVRGILFARGRSHSGSDDGESSLPLDSHRSRAVGNLRWFEAVHGVETTPCRWA